MKGERYFFTVHFVALSASLIPFSKFNLKPRENECPAFFQVSPFFIISIRVISVFKIGKIGKNKTIFGHCGTG